MKLVGFGINRFLRCLSLKMIYYEFKRAQYFRRFKGQQLVLGIGCKITNAEIGFRVFIGEYTKLYNSRIGDLSYINDNSNVRNTKIGKFCSIGPGVKIGVGKHPSFMVSTHPTFYANNKIFQTFSDKMYFDEYQEVSIGNDVLIGEDALILGGVKIGDGAIIASRAVVSGDVEPYTVVGGIPSKFIKHRFNQEIIKKLIEIKWWDKDLKWIEDNYLSFHNPVHFISLCCNNA